MRSSSVLVIVGLQCLWMSAVAQPPQYVWDRTFGGDSADYARCLLPARDGGYFISGVTRSFGSGDQDFWLVKTTADGDSLWSKSIGGPYHENGYSMDTTNDGSVVLAGWSWSFSGGIGFLSKINSDGDSIWSRIYGGGTVGPMIMSVSQTSDGNFTLSGFRTWINSHQIGYWMARANSSGDTLWNKGYGADEFNRCFTALHTSDGGYLLVGWTGHQDFQPEHCLVIKTDQNGDSLWGQMYEMRSEFYKAAESNNGDYLILCDSTYGSAIFTNALRISSNGNPLWHHTWIDRELSCALPTTDGGFILGGSIAASPQTSDLLLQRIDADGNDLWSWTYDRGNQEGCTAILRHSEGGLVLAGNTGMNGMSDFWLIRTTTPDLNSDHVHINRPRCFSLDQNYPNPFNAQTEIQFDMFKTANASLVVYNLLGREVSILVNGSLAAGLHRTPFYGQNLPSGVYVYRLSVGDQSISKRMMLLK